WAKAGYWVLVDDLDGGAEHEIQVRFQFAPLDVLLEPSSWARARDARGHGLLVRAFASVSLKAELREGVLAPEEGWVSPDYGQRITSGDGYVEFSARETMALRYVGLTDETAGINPDRFAFAIRLQDGRAEVREHGVYRADVDFVRGDVFRIAVESGVASYLKS